MGIEKGRQQGLQQGHQEGEASLLKRQLRRRFGPLPDWVESRLAQASPAELERWGERVLEAHTLAEVFSPPA